jgi:hypothetical protein
MPTREVRSGFENLTSSTREGLKNCQALFMGASVELAAGMIHRITDPGDKCDVQPARLPESKQRSGLHFDRQYTLLCPSYELPVRFAIGCIRSPHLSGSHASADRLPR